MQLAFEGINDKEINYILDQLHQIMDPLDPNRYRKKPFNLRKTNGERVWDGRVKIMNRKKKTVPTGLYPELYNFLIKLKDLKGYDFKFVDNRGPKLTANIPNSITLDGHGEEKTITLRDYQYQSVVNALREQNGILLEATNAGKSAVSISLYKYLLPTLDEGQKLLFIAPNSSIMNQLYLKFQHYIGKQYVGVWGNGKKDLTPPIICATIHTIASAIKEPETKLTHKKDKLVERLATRYAPAVLEKGSPRANLKLLALNFKPKYKYEQDDLELLRSLTMSLQTDDDVRGCMEAYQKKYKKLLYKLNKKGYEKYYEAINTLKSVRGVVCDEAHSAGAISYWNVFQYMTNARLRIGMTGTLDKSKKIHMQRIKSILGNPIISVTNKQMIDRGVSAKPHIRMVPIDQPTNLEQQIGAIAQKKGIVGGSTSDLMMYQLAYQLGVVQNSYRNSIIAQLANATAEQLDKQAGLIIVNSIEHGENICKELDKLDADYLFIQGKDDTETREKALTKVRNGELKILIGTKIIDTGIDVDRFKALILCSSGKSYISLLQRIGRILRMRKDKKEVIVFDLLVKTSEILYKHGKQRIRYYKEQGFDVK